MNRLAPKQAVQKHWFYCKTSQSLLVIQKVAMAASWGYACGGREKKWLQFYLWQITSPFTVTRVSSKNIFALFRITVSPRNCFQSSDGKTQNKSTQNPLFFFLYCFHLEWFTFRTNLTLYVSCLFEISTRHHARCKLKEKKEKGNGHYLTL